MLNFKQGDIFEQDAEAIVNPVNCVGVMGRGLALTFRNRFPDNYREYARACHENQVVPGRMFVFKTYWNTNPQYIINFPTKRHWRDRSLLMDVQEGLECPRPGDHGPAHNLRRNTRPGRRAGRDYPGSPSEGPSSPAWRAWNAWK